MSGTGHVSAALVAAQMGRSPREPWDVAATCANGFPTVIASPPTLADGERFPTAYWLTCPYLAEALSSRESAGAVADWNARLAADTALVDRMRAADADLRSARLKLAGGHDPCGDVGIAGAAEGWSSAKCLHAHVALTLVGIDDPIGTAELDAAPMPCPDERCARLPVAGEVVA